MSSTKTLLALAMAIQAPALFGMCIAIAVKYRGMSEEQRRLPADRLGEAFGTGFWLAFRVLSGASALTLLAFKLIT